MKYQIALVDDDLDDLEKACSMIQTYFSSANKEASIDKVHDSLKFDNEKNYDLLFLDIEMPNQTGFDLAKEYMKTHKETLIVFITDHKELVYSACNLHPFDFIRKENLALELPYVLDEALYRLTEMNPTVSFQSNGSTYLIHKNSIIFCESFNHNTVIHYDDKELNVYLQLKEVIEKINLDYFMRVNRSYYVNMKKVIKLAGKHLYLEDNHIVEISRQKRAMIADYLNGGWNK